MTYKDIAGVLFFVLFTIGPILQLVTLIRVKNSQSLSVPCYWVNTIGQICTLVYNTDNQSTFWTVATAISGIVTNIITLYFIRLYDRRRVL